VAGRHPTPRAHFSLFWSAAIHRRFLSLLPLFVASTATPKTKESGDESPHSKGRQKKAAMNRRTPKKRHLYRAITRCRRFYP
jgi:hypothetical protein